jgi:hypothetical protein
MFETIACSSIVDPWASVSCLDWTSGSLWVLGDCFVFKREPRNKWMCMEAHWKIFGVWSQEETINEEILSGTPSSKCVAFVQVDFWKNERDKDNPYGVELSLLGFDCQEANQPHPTHLWSTGGVVSNIRFGRSGCYLSMLTISLKPGITRNLNHLLPGTSLGIWRKENLNEDERGGFKVAKVKLPLSEGRVKTFSWGERRLVRGRTSCAGEGNEWEGL